MRYEWDENKRRGNVEKHGVDFSAVYGFQWESAFVVIDERRAYGERRYIALGLIRGRHYVVVVTLRENGFRVITLRKANAREVKRYEAYRQRA